MRKIPPKLSSVQASLLFGMFIAFNEGLSEFTFKYISDDLLNNKVGQPLLRMAITQLTSDGHIRLVPNRMTESWVLTPTTYQAFEKRLHEGEETISQVWEDGYMFLLDEPKTPSKSSPQAPTANGYVSVKHNQEPTDKLGRTLSEIRDEFKRDHNKGELANFPIEVQQETLSEISGTLAQVDEGKIRVGQLLDGLLPALTKALDYIKAYPALLALITDAIHLIKTIIAAVGKIL